MKKRMQRNLRHMAHRIDYTLYNLAYPQPRNNPLVLLMSGTASMFMLICVLILARPVTVNADSGNFQAIAITGPGSTSIIETVQSPSGLEMESNPTQEVSSPVVQTGICGSVSYGPGVQLLPTGMEAIDKTPVYIAYAGEVNKRSQPSTDAEVIGTYVYRDIVEVVAKGNGWYKTTDGGYIYENATSLEKPPTMTNLGAFKITAYCNCRICCGKNSIHGLTRTGTVPQENHTISVDPRVIPLGSKVMIGGQIYTAEDTGSAIKGNIIDMYFNSHQVAKEYGVKWLDVYILGWD